MESGLVFTFTAKLKVRSISNVSCGTLKAFFDFLTALRKEVLMCFRKLCIFSFEIWNLCIGKGKSGKKST